jgi:hypothetical protein
LQPPGAAVEEVYVGHDDASAACLIDSSSVPILPVDFTELFYDKPGSFHNTVDAEISSDIVSLGTWYNREDHEPVSLLQLRPTGSGQQQPPEPDCESFWITLTRHMSDPSTLLASRFTVVRVIGIIWITCIIGITSWRHYGSLGGFYSLFSSNTVTTSRSGGGRGGSVDYEAIISAVDTSLTDSKTDMYTAPGTQPSSSQLHCSWDAAVILYLALKTNIFFPFVLKMKIYWDIVIHIFWHLKTNIFLPIVLKMKIHWDVVIRIFRHLKTTIFLPIVLKMKIHWDVVIRIFRYLKTTIFFPFVLKMKNIITGLSLEKGETSRYNLVTNYDVSKLVKNPQPGCFPKGDSQRHQWREANANLSTDICGPIASTSTIGRRYLIVFVSRSSGYTHTYFFMRKSEAFDALNELLSDISTKALAALAHQGLTHRLLGGHSLP